MEKFCVNRLIWFYDWSPIERTIQFILIALYLGTSVLFLSRIRNTVSAGSKKAIALVEGSISVLFVLFLLASVRFSDVSVWLTLLLQVYVCIGSILLSKSKNIQKA